MQDRLVRTSREAAAARLELSSSLAESSSLHDSLDDCECYVPPSPVSLPIHGECGIPPLAPHERDKVTLVLDLDETLVHSSFVPIPRYDFTIRVDIDNKLQTVYVVKRPGVEQFLSAMADKFEVVLFTASLQKYADPLVDRLDYYSAIRHRLYRESCRLYGGGLVKDLSILGRDLHKVIIVDNSPHSYALQPQNAVPITSFIDNPRDRELLELIPYLSVLSEFDNVTAALNSCRYESLKRY
ncbi:hypothetical protein SELMODRAFT_131302 [Selaginella moellendorffii]|uniref:FCP1 homology domain-containing protein n=1 Tax=Selaginella moellendorffii TaxID=88036 RepID=D8T3V9_SELML|nr:hypothetical protein SELMODRAFT_131302 [Selaginella moellendorffii]